MQIEQKLISLGITLPPRGPSLGSFVPAVPQLPENATVEIEMILEISEG